MRVRRLEIVDEYLEGGLAAVYSTKGMVILLSELATTAWAALDGDWVSTDVVVERLLDVYGEPADRTAQQATQEALHSLAGMSLVELDSSAIEGQTSTP